MGKLLFVLIVILSLHLQDSVLAKDVISKCQEIVQDLRQGIVSFRYPSSRVVPEARTTFAEKLSSEHRKTGSKPTSCRRREKGESTIRSKVDHKLDKDVPRMSTTKIWLTRVWGLLEKVTTVAAVFEFLLFLFLISMRRLETTNLQVTVLVTNVQEENADLEEVDEEEEDGGIGDNTLIG